VLYIESFGNPRKFARTARRVSGTMPVLTVQAGRSATAPDPTPLVSRDALFEQAGVITAAGLGELVEATALLATQPVPAGRTVAIVSNVGGAGMLAADACTDLGLTVHRPQGLARRRLRALVPAGATVTGPVDTTAAVSGEEFRRCLGLLAADEDVCAIIALVLPTGATGDLAAAIGEADVGIPVAAVVLNQPESVRLLPRPGREGHIPAYGYPEAAAADTEVAVKVTDDHVFGSLVVLGLSGPDVRASDVPAEHAARLTPLTDTDADKLIGSVRSAPLHSGALRELLLRVSRFAEDLPEVSELDLSPVIAGPERASVLGACVKVTPSQPQDPFLRKLR
jgi:ATP-grasp domain/Succinyl-CoA ligase like flavodoxin domain